MTASQIAAKLKRYKSAYIDGKSMFGYGKILAALFELIIELAERVAILEKENG